MNTFASYIVGLVSVVILLAGCSTTPNTDAKKTELNAAVKSALVSMNFADTTFESFLSKAYGYVVFPSAGKGGLIVGGAYGQGETYEQGKLIGYADITQATIGLQAGGSSFTEVICFEDKAALDRFINNKLEFTANASAVAMQSGAAATAKYSNGVAVFIKANAGLMAEAAVGGQKFSFAPLR